jgi:aminopeptidase C
LIEEKVIKNKVTPKFFNQINGKVLFYEKKLSKLLSDVVELFEKEKSSNIDWVLYNDLIMKITYSLKIEPGLFDYIFLPKDNDFETVESEFLKFFNDFEEFNLEDYNPEEFRDYISLNNEVY